MIYCNIKRLKEHKWHKRDLVPDPTLFSKFFLDLYHGVKRGEQQDEQTSAQQCWLPTTLPSNAGRPVDRGRGGQ